MKVNDYFCGSNYRYTFIRLPAEIYFRYTFLLVLGDSR